MTAPLPGIEPPRPSAPARSEDTTGESPRGATLWEMALEGGAPTLVGRDPAPLSVAPRRRVPRWALTVIGVAALGGVVLAVRSFEAGKATPATSDQWAGSNPGASPSTPSASPGSQSPGSQTACSAQPLAPTAPVGATTEILVAHVPPGSAITIDLAYPGGTARYSVPSSSSGVTEVPVAVGGAPPGQPVQVSVTAGSSSCHTLFTVAPAPQG